MKNLFIPYEFAVKLKELGFNEECLGKINYKDELTFDFPNTITNQFLETSCACPLWQQAFDWLLNKTTDEYSFEQVGDSYYIVYEGMDMERRTLAKGSREICLEKLIKIVS